MKSINSAFLGYLGSELVGGADIDELVTRYYNIDSNNPVIMKNIIKNVLKPTFDNFSYAFKQKAKDCLGFYLSTGKVDFEDAYNANLFPLETPKNPRLFYEWIWEIYFGNEDYKAYNNKDFYEIYDINEPNYL